MGAGSEFKTRTQGWIGLNLFSSQNVTPLVYRSAVKDTARTVLNGVSTNSPPRTWWR
ncbi:hypothetical protein [Streptomyces chartreusis]|uniref:hypothetical protein n=1 Tax=Streptomyces chartreusis TaxID=1969 RepID=UPI0033EFA0E0